jgi:cell division protein FtsB
MNIQWSAFNPLHWKRSFLIGMLVAFILLWIGFLDTYSIWARVRLSSERADMISRTEQLIKESDELDKKIKALQADPSLLERIAREEYGMRRPGETVYRIQTAD